MTGGRKWPETWFLGVIYRLSNALIQVFQANLAVEKT
jgi:hypothetical protein